MTPSIFATPKPTKSHFNYTNSAAAWQKLKCVTRSGATNQWSLSICALHVRMKGECRNLIVEYAHINDNFLYVNPEKCVCTVRERHAATYTLLCKM